MANHFPHFSFSGDARVRGLAHGRTLGQRIHAVFAHYHERLFAKSGLSDTELNERAERVRAIILAFNEEYVIELDAIAEAAALPRWQIYVLNARTEILNADIGECTSLCFPEARLLGQTWDWFEEFEDFAVLVTYIRPSGPDILALTEPGMLAKIGLNSSGIGICLNFLQHQHALDGVPVHILTRAILDCDSVKTARLCIARSGYGKSSHFLIADSNGDVHSIEFMGDTAAEVEPLTTAYLHTNHCISPGAPDDATEETSSSALRLKAGRTYLHKNARRSFDVMQNLLSREEGGDFAINNPYHSSVNFPGERIGTCATLLMDLTRRQIHVRKGPHDKNPFEVYALEQATSGIA
jgi:isopenicillin-N N-acyltransferase-like protein